MGKRKGEARVILSSFPFMGSVSGRNCALVPAREAHGGSSFFRWPQLGDTTCSFVLLALEVITAFCFCYSLHFFTSFYLAFQIFHQLCPITFLVLISSIKN